MPIIYIVYHVIIYVYNSCYLSVIDYLTIIVTAVSVCVGGGGGWGGGGGGGGLRLELGLWLRLAGVYLVVAEIVDGAGQHRVLSRYDRHVDDGHVERRLHTDHCNTTTLTTHN